jgi:hypothetical protein
MEKTPEELNRICDQDLKPLVDELNAAVDRHKDCDLGYILLVIDHKNDFMRHAINNVSKRAMEAGAVKIRELAGIPYNLFNLPFNN